jgi:hypothetical protein
MSENVKTQGDDPVTQAALERVIAAVDAMSTADLETFRANWKRAAAHPRDRQAIEDRYQSGSMPVDHRADALQRAALINAVTQLIKGDPIRPEW